MDAEGLLSGTTYEWRVVARNDYAWGNEAATWRFTTGSFSAVSASRAGNAVRLVELCGGQHAILMNGEGN